MNGTDEVGSSISRGPPTKPIKPPRRRVYLPGRATEAWAHQAPAVDLPGALGPYRAAPPYLCALVPSWVIEGAIT